MKTFKPCRLVIAGFVALACTAAQSPCGGETSGGRQRASATLASVIPFTGVAPSVVGDATLAVAEWKQGIGCLTNLPAPYACFSSADPTDASNTGLFLAKTGPTTSDPAVDLSAYPAGIDADLAPYAVADLQGVAGSNVADLTELGYDLRKPDSTILGVLAPLAGSHCGVRSPRFNVVTQAADGTTSTHRFYCWNGSSPSDGAIQGWIRLRWTPDMADPAMAPTDTIQSIKIVFDEGLDPAGGPDVFGVAILDNIDVNGILVGTGPAVAPPPGGDGDDDGQGEDEHERSFHFHLNRSHTDRSRISYTDTSAHLKFVSRTGVQNVHTTGPKCVAFDADGAVNRKPGYTATFEVCDLSNAQGTAIGKFSISITGPNGFRYQNSSTMTRGRVSIHG